jgi:hypothetical protein
LKKVIYIFENFNVSKNNIFCAKAAKVPWYLNFKAEENYVLQKKVLIFCFHVCLVMMFRCPSLLVTLVISWLAISIDQRCEHNGTGSQRAPYPAYWAVACLPLP